MAKLAFIREPGQGQPIWNGATYPTPGWPLVRNIPSQPETVMGTTESITKWTPNGKFSPLAQPTRPAYIPTVHATSPDAWQSGFATNWDHLCVRPVLVQQFGGAAANTHAAVTQQGKAVIQPSTTYIAGPSMGQTSVKLTS